MSTHSWLKVILVLWVLGFLVAACGPTIAADGIGGTLIGAVFGLVLGSILIVPFLLGVGVLLVLIWLTKPRGRTGDGRYPDGRYPDDRFPR